MQLGRSVWRIEQLGLKRRLLLGNVFHRAGQLPQPDAGIIRDDLLQRLHVHLVQRDHAVLCRLAQHL